MGFDVESTKTETDIMKKLLVLFTLSLLAGLVFATPSPPTGQITFGWSYDFQANPGVTNFVVYYWLTAGSATNSMNAGTNLTLTVTGLIRGASYTANGTAQSNLGLEGDYSTNATKVVDMKPAKLPTFIAQ